MSETSDDETLRREMRALERAGNLHAIHWLIVFASLVVTVFAWRASSDSVDERAASRFDRQADQVTELFRERLQMYADFLQTTVGFVAASEDTTPAAWRRFVAEVDVSERYPAITALGVVEAVTPAMLPRFLEHQRRRWPEFPAPGPAEDRVPYYPIVAVSPERLEKRAIGLDVGREARRRDAVSRALASGTTQITAPIQPTPRDALGFLMFTAFERTFAAPDEVRAAGRVATGAVAMTVLVEDLVAGILDKERRQLWVRLADQGETIYDEHDSSAADIDPDPLFTRSEDIDVFGRRWHFDIVNTLAFREDATSIEPTLILAGGLSIDALLLLLFVLLSRSNRRALSFAERAGKHLRAANEELEEFAYVVSHDLKAPLQNIGHLAEFIEEDLEHYEATVGRGPDIRRDVGRIRQQVGRAGRLIEGVLDYTGLGARPERPVRVDTRALLDGIRDTLGPHAARLALEGDFPTLVTYETRLEQVLANLVGNAFKYHHDAANAHVVVAVERAGERLRFSVEDDGPGIDARFHDRVFELFHTLGSEQKVDSTGVGLAIVKKTVELMDGTISIDSAPGRGTTFTFDWPRHVAGAAGGDATPGAETAGTGLAKAA